MDMAIASAHRRPSIGYETVGYGLAAAAVVFVLANLTTRSLWWDELFSMALASPATSPEEAMRQIQGDVHPPLYFMGLRAWLGALQSSSDFAGRLFNIIPYAMAACAAAIHIRSKGPSWAPLWAILFFTSFGVLWYLQEMRMYAMVVAQSFVGCLIVMAFHEDRHSTPSWAYAGACLIAFVVLPLGHWFSFAFAGLLLIGLSLWALSSSRWSYLAVFVSQGVILGAIGVGWILMNLGTTLGGVADYGGHIYGGSLSLWGLKTAATGALLYALSLNPLLLAAASFGVWRALRSPDHAAGAWIILGASIALTAAILAVSIFSPMYQARNFTWLVGPATLFAAIGVEGAFKAWRLSDWDRMIGLVVISSVSLTSALLAHRVYPLELDEWRKAGAYVSVSGDCKNPQVYASAQWLDPNVSTAPTALRYSRDIYDHYARPNGVSILTLNDTLPEPASDTCSRVLWIGQTDEAGGHRIANQLMKGDFDPDQFKIVRFRGHMVIIDK